MDDMVSRQAAIDGVKTLHDVAWKNWHEPTLSANVVLNMIRELPSTQPEIIRCKECKHWLDIDDGRQKHRMCADVYGDWFCADAERRTDEFDGRENLV